MNRKRSKTVPHRNIPKKVDVCEVEEVDETSKVELSRTKAKTNALKEADVHVRSYIQKEKATKLKKLPDLKDQRHATSSNKSIKDKVPLNEIKHPKSAQRDQSKVKSLNELIEAHKSSDGGLENVSINSQSFPNDPTTSDKPEPSTEAQDERSLKILRLTKMKWLYNDHSVESESRSTTSLSSIEENIDSSTDKHLSTIIQLDKECNLFGLSNFNFVPKQKKKHDHKKHHEKPVFSQTTIVQTCCACGGCCRYVSNTGLPESLKGRNLNIYGSPCIRKCCKSCRSLCTPAPCCLSMCPPKCRPRPCIRTPKMTILERPKLYKYEPEKVELTPRSSCIMSLPLMARECTHTPRCVPPSPGFPYCLPCYWPARPSAPCNGPCFHHPPCLPRYKAKSTCAGHRNPDIACVNHPCKGPKKDKDKDKKKKGKKDGEDKKKEENKCENILCLGKNKEFAAEFKKKYESSGKEKPKEKPKEKAKEKEKGKAKEKEKKKKEEKENKGKGDSKEHLDKDKKQKAKEKKEEENSKKEEKKKQKEEEKKQKKEEKEKQKLEEKMKKQSSKNKN